MREKGVSARLSSIHFLQVSESDNNTVLCILCQEEEPIGGENMFVLTSLVHRSHLLKPSATTTTTSTGDDGGEDYLIPTLNNETMVSELIKTPCQTPFLPCSVVFRY